MEQVIWYERTQINVQAYIKQRVNNWSLLKTLDSRRTQNTVNYSEFRIIPNCRSGLRPGSVALPFSDFQSRNDPVFQLANRVSMYDSVPFRWKIVSELLEIFGASMLGSLSRRQKATAMSIERGPKL